MTRIVERENPIVRQHRQHQERERAEAKLTPTPTPQPDRQAKPQPAVASVYRGRTVSDAAWRQEYERRMDWLSEPPDAPPSTT